MNEATNHDIDQLALALSDVVESALSTERAYQTELRGIEGERLDSARNLIHYLALRQIDLRGLQMRLAQLGLSSLGRSEAHVLSSLRAVLCALRRIQGTSRADTVDEQLDFESGIARLRRRAEVLFGTPRGERNVRIMVTMPSSAASDPRLIDEVLQTGVELIRINGAHDDRVAWKQMIKNLRRAEKKQAKGARVAFDLAGPKLRTGEQQDPDEKILLSPGDRLVLTSLDKLGRPGKRKKDGTRRPARIPCSLPEVFSSVEVGQRVWLDDGKIGGVIESVTADECVVDVRYAMKHCARLRPEKGINLPDSRLDLPCLTSKDLEDLDFAVKYADIISLSFVRSPEDVLDLYRELEARNALHLGVLLKIETPQAFEALPRILLAGLRFERLGVMVARGDLAVEVGFARLAEVQEEILWFAEAAHLPVVWATQVLENLTKTGMPSRAEVTDKMVS